MKISAESLVFKSVIKLVLYQIVMKIWWYFAGPHARTKDGELWVWQMREERENISDQEEDNLQADMFIIVFATAGNLHHLGRAATWYGDGKFSVCPSLFYQLYTIHAEVHGQIVPLVFNLLPSKSKRCYQFMWLQLRNLVHDKGVNPVVKS